MRSKRARIGDVIEIATPKGYAYAQLTHRDRVFGCLLRILPGIHRVPPLNLAAKVLEQELYHVFVFEDDLSVEPVTRIVSHEEVPQRCSSLPMFRDGVRDPKTG